MSIEKHEYGTLMVTQESERKVPLKPEWKEKPPEERAVAKR